MGRFWTSMADQNQREVLVVLICKAQFTTKILAKSSEKGIITFKDSKTACN